MDAWSTMIFETQRRYPFIPYRVPVAVVGQFPRQGVTATSATSPLVLAKEAVIGVRGTQPATVMTGTGATWVVMFLDGGGLVLAFERAIFPEHLEARMTVDFAFVDPREVSVQIAVAFVASEAALVPDLIESDSRLFRTDFLTTCCALWHLFLLQFYKNLEVAKLDKSN